MALLNPTVKSSDYGTLHGGFSMQKLLTTTPRYTNIREFLQAAETALSGRSIPGPTRPVAALPILRDMQVHSDMKGKALVYMEMYEPAGDYIRLTWYCSRGFSHQRSA